MSPSPYLHRCYCLRCVYGFSSPSSVVECGVSYTCSHLLLRAPPPALHHPPPRALYCCRAIELASVTASALSPSLEQSRALPIFKEVVPVTSAPDDETLMLQLLAAYRFLCRQGSGLDEI